MELAELSVSGEARGRGRTRRANPEGSWEVAHLLPRGDSRDGCGLSCPGVHWPRQKVALAASLAPGASARSERGQTLLRDPARLGCKRLSSACERDVGDGNSLFLCFSSQGGRKDGQVACEFASLKAQGDFITVCIRYQLLLEADCDISSV